MCQSCSKYVWYFLNLSNKTYIDEFDQTIFVRDKIFEIQVKIKKNRTFTTWFYNDLT